MQLQQQREGLADKQTHMSFTDREDKPTISIQGTVMTVIGITNNNPMS